MWQIQRRIVVAATTTTSAIVVVAVIIVTTIIQCRSADSAAESNFPTFQNQIIEGAVPCDHVGVQRSLELIQSEGAIVLLQDGQLLEAAVEFLSLCFLQIDNLHLHACRRGKLFEMNQFAEDVGVNLFHKRIEQSELTLADLFGHHSSLEKEWRDGNFKNSYLVQFKACNHIAVDEIPDVVAPDRMRAAVLLHRQRGCIVEEKLEILPKRESQGLIRQRYFLALIVAYRTATPRQNSFISAGNHNIILLNHDTQTMGVVDVRADVVEHRQPTFILAASVPLFIVAAA